MLLPLEVDVVRFSSRAYFAMDEKRTTPIKPSATQTNMGTNAPSIVLARKVTIEKAITLDM